MSQVGFRQEKPQGRVAPYEVFYTGFLYMYAGANRDMHVYVNTLKDMRIHLKKCVDTGRRLDHTFSGLSAVVFLSMGHYPYYKSPYFRIIKSFLAMVFPPGFFQGYLPKNIGVYVCMIWFLSFVFARFIELNISAVYFYFVSC